MNFNHCFDKQRERVTIWKRKASKQTSPLVAKGKNWELLIRYPVDCALWMLSVKAMFPDRFKSIRTTRCQQYVVWF